MLHRWPPLVLLCFAVACSAPSPAADASVADAELAPDLALPPDLGLLPDGGVGCTARRLRIAFTPTARAQLAIYVQSDDHSRFATIALTDATGRRGLGNRPGAMDMNSGYHWPDGRREGVLPFWANARAHAGGTPFPRVIRRNRASEGDASQVPLSASDPYRDTVDTYYCLSFVPRYSDRDHLDAVACASALNNDKGRYITSADLAIPYVEPYETPSGAGYRPLSATSLYPPRRDVLPTPDDHPDVTRYPTDALAAMPELDAVTMATPPGDAPYEQVWDIPCDWPAALAEVDVEVNTEGDYDDAFGPSQYPTPTMPAGSRDLWSVDFGYPYRGQPSVLFRVVAGVSASGGPYTSRAPDFFAALDGSDTSNAMDATMTDDPGGHPGSGADRLRVRPSGDRVTVTFESP